MRKLAWTNKKRHIQHTAYPHHSPHPNHPNRRKWHNKHVYTCSNVSIFLLLIITQPLSGHIDPLWSQYCTLWSQKGVETTTTYIIQTDLNVTINMAPVGSYLCSDVSFSLLLTIHYKYI